MFHKKLKLANFIHKIGFSELLIFTLFAAILLFIAFYFSRTKKWVTLTMKVTSSNVMEEYVNIPFWLINTVKTGDKEFDGLGQSLVEIIDIKTYETEGNYLESYITVKLKALYDKVQHKYTFSSKNLFIGGGLSVKPNGILLEGIVTEIEGITDNRKKVHKKVLVQIEGGLRTITTGVRPWFVKAINIGDEIRDYHGKTIAKVLDKRVEPALRITTDDKGNAHLIRDPYLQDLYLVLDLLTIEEKGLYYFRDTEKIKINQSIPLLTEKFDIRPIIIDILE